MVSLEIHYEGGKKLEKSLQIEHPVVILHSGTELSKRGVLLDRGRGAINQTRGANASRARSRETSKKKETALAA